MYRTNQPDLPLRCSAHNFVGADNDDVQMSAVTGLLLIQTACAARSEPALPSVTSEASGLSPAALDQLSDALQGFVDDGKLSGRYYPHARQRAIRPSPSRSSPNRCSSARSSRTSVSFVRSS